MESTRALMQSILDYASLFPPALWDMPKTVATYKRYRAGPDRWVLSRLVIPITRLGEFERVAKDLLPQGDRDDSEDPWPLTVLSAATSDEALEEDLEKIERFNTFHAEPGAGRAVVDSIELKATNANAIEQSLELMPETLFPWYELPWQQDVRGMIAALSEMESGAKIRTGGTEAAAHPSPLELARFLALCHHADVPFKATAGLHHPYRHFAESVGCEQFGFVNLFFGAALLHHNVIEQEELEMLLGDQHAKNFEFTPTTIAWKGRSLGVGQIRDARDQFARSFGSCSFEEPLSDLRSLHLLPPSADKA